MKKCLFAAVLAITCFCGIASAEDPYQLLATEISQAGGSLGNKKLAIIPFSYADGRTAAKDGSIIAERLTMKMIKLQKFEIIERSVLDKVMAELKLQASGMIDASSAQQLGKVLGVDAIVTGTLVETSNGQIEVNARLIKTETAQAIGASQVQLDKNWIGDAATTQPQQPTYEQPAYPQPVKQVYSAPKARSEYEYGYFDVIGGGGTQTTDIKWANTLGSVEQPDLITSGVGPVGFRVGGYGKGAFGGDFEFSVSKHYIEAQRSIAITSGLAISANLPAGYLDTTSIGLSGDLLLRTRTKAQFYMGLGLGLSINNIKSTVIRDIHNVLLNETAVGFMFRVPVGIRLNMGNTTFFLEGRVEANATSFKRGSATEVDNVTFVGTRGVFGVGTKF